MGFSLSSFVKHAAGDINPFDGPQPASTAPPKPAAAPMPAPQAQQPHQNPFQHAVGNVLHAGGNVVNAGATAARDTYGGVKAVGRFTVATPDHNVVAPFVANVAKSTVHQAVALPKSVYDIGRGAAADISNNPVALANANKAKAQNEGAFLQPIFRPVAQTVRTIEHPLTPNSFQAKSPDAKVIFGATPVQNVAAGVKSNFQQHANLPLPQRIALSTAYGTGQVAQDALLAAGAHKVGSEVGNTKLVQNTTGAIKETVAPKFNGLKPEQIIMDTKKLDTLNNAKNYSPFEAGNSTQAAQDIISGLHQIKQDHGLDFVTGSIADRQQRIAQYLEQNGAAIPLVQAHAAKIAARKQAVADFADKHPIGLTSGAVDDQGNKLGLNGKPLRQPKADTVPGAALPQPTTKLVPGAALKQSKPADSMTPINAIIADKKAKLGQPKQPDVAPVPGNPEAPLPTPGDLPTANAGPVKRTRFTKRTVQNSDQVSPAVKAKTDASYTSDTMKAAAERAQQHIKANGAKKSLEQTLSELNAKRGTASRDTIARAIELAARHDAKGTEAASTMAAKLLELAGEHGSAHGQSAQILSAIARRSPAGLRNKAFKDLKEKAGIDVLENNDKKIGDLKKQLSKQVPGSKEHMQTTKQLKDLTERDAKNKAIRKEIQGHIDTVNKLPDGPMKDMQIAVLQKAVHKHLPQSKVDNAISIWKAGLLSGAKTHAGNVASNVTFGALKKVSDFPAKFADNMMALATKKETIGLTGRGLAKGTGEGFQYGFGGAGHALANTRVGKLVRADKVINEPKTKGTLVTGIDARNVGDKYEQHAEINLKSKFLQKALGNPANGVFRVLGAADQPTYYAALKNSLYDQAKADGHNLNLTGKAMRQHMDELVQNPTEAMSATAIKEANKSVLNYDTFASKAVQFAHRGIDSLPSSTATDAGKKLAHATLNILAPFVRVPSAFISRTIDFTPLGIPKEVFHQAASKHFDQRALSQAIGESATGTGIIALGAVLTRHGLISGDYPKNDPKEQARWKAEGITPNSVKVGDKWVSLNYMGPVGLLFNAGHNLETAKGESAQTKAGAAIGGLGQGLLGQSFLQGFSGFSDAIQDPNRNLKSFVNSQASSVVPSAVNDVANATDRSQRRTDNVPQALKNRIPGARESLPTKTDVYGNDLPNPNFGFNQINPLKPSASLTDKSSAVAEVSRLHNVNPGDSTLQATPTPVGKTVTIDGKNINLSDPQRADLQKAVGQETQSKWNDLITTPEYQAMTDNQKAAALGNIQNLANEDATRAYVTKNAIGTYTKPESTKAQALQDGSYSVADLAASKDTGGTSITDTKAYYKSPGAEYKALQKQFDAQNTKGFNSPAAKIKAQNALDKAKAGAGFDKTIRDAYDLSTDDLYKYVSTDPNGADIAKKVIAYGDALVSAGVSDKNKLKDKYGNVILKPKVAAGNAAGKKAISDFISTSKATNAAASKNQSALQSLLKNAKVSSPGSGNTKIKVAKAVLKKQTIKKQKAKVA